MTRSHTRRRSPRQTSLGKRPGYLYEFEGWDPRELIKFKLKKIWLYVGQTRQNPMSRWRQHEFGADDGEPPKIWWALVTDKHVAKTYTFISDDKLDLAEGWRITQRKPVANIQRNMHNSNRIPPWEMKDLMQRINRMGGVDHLVREARRRSWGARFRRWLPWLFRGDNEGARLARDPKSGAITWYGKPKESLARFSVKSSAVAERWEQ